MEEDVEEATLRPLEACDGAVEPLISGELPPLVSAAAAPELPSLDDEPPPSLTAEPLPRKYARSTGARLSKEQPKREKEKTRFGKGARFESGEARRETRSKVLVRATIPVFFSST